MSDNKKRSGPREGGGQHKKAKGHWGGPYKGSGQSIAVGSVGIYATCDNGKDKKATDELIQMLEESFTRLGKDHVGRSDATAAAAAAADAGGDGSSKGSSIADMLAAEVAQLKDKRKDRFKRREGGVRGTLFVEFPTADDCPSPEEVVLDICRHVQATQSLPSRHLMRLLPVSHTCGISKDEITAMAAKVAAQHFPTGDDAASIEFAVEFEHRANDKLDRKEVIDIVAKAVQAPHKVNLRTPQKTIIVQLVRTVCCICVVPSYKELSRFNVRKLAEDELEGQAEQKQQPAAAAAAPPQEKAAEAAEQAEKQDAGAAAAEEKAAAVEAKDEAAEAPAAAENAAES
ncbi:hypothetical protein OEZ85_006843 [Tetradesmus obliquus]|uniref:THUMP domain-containing protein n=1 Tax=Tetradesmus obliquus TaxID=3088 RepID=A0ABY8TVX5_TETOB|nr:hypothetical protein OEZ85_006843 [Tetradesmus obliquus]